MRKDKRQKLNQNYIELVNKFEAEKNKQYEKWSKEFSNYSYNKCPLCKSNNLVDKIKRIKGGGSGSGNFLFYYQESSIDTIAVRSCNSCGHEWNESDVKPKHGESARVIFEDYYNSLYMFCYKIKEIKKKLRKYTTRNPKYAEWLSRKEYKQYLEKELFDNYVYKKLVEECQFYRKTIDIYTKNFGCSCYRVFAECYKTTSTKKLVELNVVKKL